MAYQIVAWIAFAVFAILAGLAFGAVMSDRISKSEADEAVWAFIVALALAFAFAIVALI